MTVMASIGDAPELVDKRFRRERSYWIGRLMKRGMTLEQATKLVEQNEARLHDVEATLEQGCDPSVAFDIYS